MTPARHTWQMVWLNDLWLDLNYPFTLEARQSVHLEIFFLQIKNLYFFRLSDYVPIYSTFEGLISLLCILSNLKVVFSDTKLNRTSFGPVRGVLSVKNTRYFGNAPSGILMQFNLQAISAAFSPWSYTNFSIRFGFIGLKKILTPFF